MSVPQLFHLGNELVRDSRNRWYSPLHKSFIKKINRVIALLILRPVALYTGNRAMLVSIGVLAMLMILVDVV